ncbi:ATP phosphoribosyltransferase regulatory subunit [Roseinatronobacter bogoriensis]|uniref:ATP phosphoribosyltransferase regulatory subunit n=1 Tax=Roseinatronobacter bogoriensis subsp. barguzinensis TaxID=441209 RepID=A0A2K8K8J1_9RHOB|nr:MULTISPECIES: ATP phosphoribosyltransferase regulatory subunit [Rhodobaca]ATX65256.1 ATP phosphoribosyltransferase regulatory subunit [Rhodobaca barguzinensis]MBB4209363.1 ATP phosphoribosyltransferase regulatory subunit [Rhodobaca bogoriensis DSM 18756]TDW34575.1 ATP phosphoribosyltransferase regulatory subunit [Rhodobaca barguzinensis]TDY67105.1 ATP phosphoribosyltransferase regulatory subunit [Rhodobaca bogoriensis DSM 18756]
MTRAEAIAAELLSGMQGAGAQPVAADILQPAETLLDLYGEDIRARAYVTHDPALGEMMLRPDFTVPVVQAHMRDGAEPARYCYSGPVFRKQERAAGRAREYLQVGYEVFARNDPARADAEVFALFARLLAGHDLRPVTGDIGILKAAVLGLETSARRKAALMRHIWRPKRFRALLERMGGHGPLAEARAELVAQLRGNSAQSQVQEAGQMVGLRSEEEIRERIASLLEDAETSPIPREQVQALEGLLSLAAPARQALAKMRGQNWAALAPALDRLEARLGALDDAGIDSTTLPFEASFGRTTMEYYDGFVFGFVSSRDDLPPVATGGRYDALTAVLGQGRAIPAVGGVIRPETLVALEAAR